MLKPNLNIILDVFINIYDITEKIYNFTIRDTDSRNDFSENIKSLYKERAVFVSKLEHLKKIQEYNDLFLKNNDILNKELKKIADIESVTISLLEKKTKELARELQEIKNKKALLIYKKV